MTARVSPPPGRACCRRKLRLRVEKRGAVGIQVGQGPRQWGPRRRRRSGSRQQPPRHTSRHTNTRTHNTHRGAEPRCLLLRLLVPSPVLAHCLGSGYPPTFRAYSKWRVQTIRAILIQGWQRTTFWKDAERKSRRGLRQKRRRR